MLKRSFCCNVQVPASSGVAYPCIRWANQLFVVYIDSHSFQRQTLFPIHFVVIPLIVWFRYANQAMTWFVTFSESNRTYAQTKDLWFSITGRKEAAQLSCKQKCNRNKHLSMLSLQAFAIRIVHSFVCLSLWLLCQHGNKSFTAKLPTLTSRSIGSPERNGVEMKMCKWCLCFQVNKVVLSLTVCEKYESDTNLQLLQIA